MVEGRGDVPSAGTGDTAEACPPSGETATPSQADTLTSAGSPRAPVGDGDDELPADVRLGRFTLLRTLGRGGMGVVYTAYDELLDRVVAIKMVRNDRDDSNLLARVLREAKALAKLSHPNVVQIHDVSESDGQVFIAMEYVDGPTLRGWVEARRRAGADYRELLGVLLQAGRGLAAAHAAGLIHRDFKPDNVLVGADGRARVLDFGLVAARTDTALRLEAAAALGSAALAGGEILTRAGAILGTPAYMSPEQWLGRSADARSDQFSFCAAVYEALHGVRPFAGTSSTELLAAMSRAELQPGENALAIPASVAAALRRGLSFKPEARFRDLDALLAELDDDASEARRRRLRLAALLAATAAVVAAVVLLGQDLQQRWLEARREADAATALAAVDARIAEARAAGDHATAARLFTTFLEEPVFQDTNSIARAWLAEAARRREDGDEQAAVSAFAQAFTRAREPADGVTALLGLVELFRARLDWDGLGQVLALLDRRHPEAGDDPAVSAVRGDAALALHDFAGAAARLDGPRGRLARALAQATPTAFPSVRQAFGRVGDELWLLEQGPAGLALHAAGADASLAPRWRHPFPPGTVRVDRVDTRDGHVVAWQEDARVLYGRAAGGGLEPVYTWPENQVYSATAADLDGDGRRELYIGAGDTCTIVEVTRDDHGRLQHRVVYTAGDSLESLANSLVALDIDGDGREELAAAFGEWRAYDVRILRKDPVTGALVTVARDKIGRAYGLGALRGAGGEQLVVAEVLRREPNLLVFPPDQPHGAAPGTYLYALAGGGLIRRAHVPFVLDTPGAVTDGVHWEPLVGDADGDGRDDFVNHYVDRSIRHSVIHLQDERGGFVPAILDGVAVLGFAQLDDDPAHELIAGVADGGGGTDLWVLGVGADRLPVRDLSVPEARSERNLASDPALRRAFTGADDLRSLGLFADAAEAYEQLARRSPAGPLRTGALVDAAALRERLGDDAAALALYGAAEDGDHAGEALAGKYRSLLRLGRYEQALHALEALRRRPELAPGQAADLLEQRDRLLRVVEGQPPLDFTFERPLAASWTVHDPLAVRRRTLADPDDSGPDAAPLASGALEIRTASAGPLAELPIEWDGETIDVGVDLTVEHTEWSSVFAVELVPESEPERPVLRLTAMAYGTSRGGQPPMREYACDAGGRIFYANSGDRSSVSRSPAARTRVRLRAFAVAPLGEIGCTLRDLDADRVLVTRDRLTHRLGPPGRYRLVVRVGNDVPAWLSVQVHRVALRGARLLDPLPIDPRRADVLRAAVEGDAVAALAALRRLDRPDPRERALLALLLVRAGRLAEAEPLWRELVADAAGRDPLLSLLRGHHAEVGPVLRAISEPKYVELLTAAWHNTGVNHLDDPRIAPVLLDILSNLAPERLVPAHAGPVELIRAADLLTWRARLQVRARRPVAAQDDFTRALALRARAGHDASILRLDLASLAASEGDLVGAREYIEAARAASEMPLLVEDIIRARPELAALAPARGR